MDIPMEVRVGCCDRLPTRMTKKQALRWGEKNMPGDLRRAGFETVVFTADIEINGWVGYRINYGKKVGVG